MRVLLALAIVVPICLVVAYMIKKDTSSKGRPSHELATAVRLLDRCAEADEVMAYLPSDTRDEVNQFLRHYHGRGLNR
jgi:hypothetical protein